MMRWYIIKTQNIEPETMNQFQILECSLIISLQSEEVSEVESGGGTRLPVVILLQCTAVTQPANTRCDINYCL